MRKVPGGVAKCQGARSGLIPFVSKVLYKAFDLILPGQMSRVAGVKWSVEGQGPASFILLSESLDH
jgi:hypothetical protein